ncbi:family 20 glycosylhydrolase [Nonomuraea typhae]|uniref:family 20 glycosylhydrolase n=1 Tax=Nonomuraea typhae TaxID=2603600 RepID=UPI0012FBF428|nr:family 20 glycosylhydrolase [Nonomuraea typhae]
MHNPRILTEDPSLQPVADVVTELLHPHPPLSADLRLTLGQVTLQPDALGVAVSGADECYRITSTPGAITCQARTPQGVFRAALQAALYGTPGHPGVIESGPRYAWRGLSLDTARTFWSVPEVKRIIDLAALHRLNVLHLHLTDNEGWRIEIPGLPHLTAGHAHYKIEEYADLQRHAAARHVVIVPEIDLPGHAAAALAADPALPNACDPHGWDGLPFAALDPRDEATRAFITRVLTEVCHLTDGPYVHFGGDEAFGMDEELFRQAVRLAREVIRAAGKKPLGWQESARAGLEPGDVAQWWVDPSMMDLPASTEGNPALAAAGLTDELLGKIREHFAPSAGDLDRIIQAGGRVLLSPQSHLYLDRPYERQIIPAEQEHAGRLGHIYRPRTVRHAADWSPSAYGLPQENVAGVEAAVWSESLRSFDDLTVMLLPRLAAIAEIAWYGRPPAWPQARAQLAASGRLWEQRGLTFLRSTEVAWI